MFITERELVQLYRLGDEVETLDRVFAELAQANEHFLHNFKKRIPALTCEHDKKSRTVVATMHGIQVVFIYQPTVDSNGKASGKAVCYRAIAAPDKVRYEAIGSFSFETSGVTDIPANEGESTPTMYGDSDGIVLYFLRKAMQAWGS